MPLPVHPPRASSSALPVGDRPIERTRVVTRINSLIRPEPWKTWAAISAAALLWIGVLWSGDVIDHERPALREVLGLAAGHATRYFIVTMLLIASGLSVIVLWYRTHSRKDFHGRYRVWIWSSLVWPIFLSAATSDWHLAASDRIAALHPALRVLFGHHFWVVPATILFWTTARVMTVDMATYGPSRWLTRAAAGFAAICLLTELRPQLLPETARIPATRFLESLWPLLLAAALLHHARFVIHVTNEVGPLRRRTGRSSPFLQEVWEEIWSIVPTHERVIETLRPASRAKSSGRLLWSLMKRSRITLPLLRRIMARALHSATRLSKSVFRKTAPPTASRAKSKRPPVEESPSGESTATKPHPVVTITNPAQSSPEHRRSDFSRRDRRLQRAGR